MENKLSKLIGIPPSKLAGENATFGYVYTLLSAKQNSSTVAGQKSLTISSLVPSMDYDYKNTADGELQSDADNEVQNQFSGPNMVIHVCDEAKNLKQDFTCPRDLLIQEMKYFADYLSVESQRLEEVDISVHCDIHIFDWLMRYVKRGTGLVEEAAIPQLDSTNVISILISSDFLKMESLVEECIAYCHKNMSSVISAPCNMNCVNDKLTTLLASRFSHNELDEVKDRKDKFKGKLYFRKIMELFEPSSSNPDSLGNASYLFKCGTCQKVMTKEQSCSIPCLSEQTSIGFRGELLYDHNPDPMWDVNLLIMQLHEELHKWSLVYWRLWGIVNHLPCSRCGQMFQLSDYGNCKYHSERAQYPLSTGNIPDVPVGNYLCCSSQILRFDPSGITKGCSAKDHVVTCADKSQHTCVDDFLSHKNAIKNGPAPCNTLHEMNIFMAEELQIGIKPASFISLQSSKIPGVPVSKSAGLLITKKSKISHLSGRGNESASEDENTAEDDLPLEKKSSFLTIDTVLQPLKNWSHGDPASLTDVTSKVGFSKKSKEKSAVPSDTTAFSKCASKQKWDSNFSVRWNQDAQREEDRKRFQNLTLHLTKLRQVDKPEKTKGKDQRELHGGIFRKLESAFFNNNRWQSQSTSFGGYGRQHLLANAKDNRSRARHLGR